MNLTPFHNLYTMTHILILLAGILSLLLAQASHAPSKITLNKGTMLSWSDPVWDRE